jgi:hypothetical protein
MQAASTAVTRFRKTSRFRKKAIKFFDSILIRATVAPSSFHTMQSIFRATTSTTAVQGALRLWFLCAGLEAEVSCLHCGIPSGDFKLNKNPVSGPDGKVRQ